MFDAFAGDELVGDAHRVARVRAVVARDHLELLAEHAALGVDLLDRELPALLVRLEEGRLRLVAVELADLDRVLRDGRRAETDDHGAGRSQPSELGSGAHAVLHFTRLMSWADRHHVLISVVPAQAGTHIPEPVVMGPRNGLPRGDDTSVNGTTGTDVVHQFVCMQIIEAAPKLVKLT